MMQSPHLEAIFTAVGVIWVGGWGFLMFRRPEFFARINVRFGMKWLSGPKYISLTKKIGIAEMVLAILCGMGFLIRAAFGWMRL
ncbi:hypothetical protein [Tunturiibacter psychrotolerans]|jgi:hypothetical protein|uniref:hypothetical protein n=1 Tax=Tunturiibacter psychrotolerans TaxID=3069686 RepID=UPI003D1FDD23